MKLAVAQVVLGVLPVSSYVAFSVWVAPGPQRFDIQPPVEGSDGPTTVLINPNMPVTGWTTVYLGLGMAVLACGVAQLVRARRPG